MSEPTSERWLPVAGYEGFYEVSDLARVRSLPRMTRHAGLKGGQILRTPLGNHGYPTVNLSVDGHRKVHLVHRLVAAAFLGPCPEGMEVRHLDGNRGRCELSNLAYGTHSENELDKLRHGTHITGSREACINGHPFSVGNVRIARHPDGSFKQRICLQCQRNYVPIRAARLPPLIATCATCEESFDRGRTLGQGRRRYCGPECRKTARAAQIAAYQERVRASRTRTNQ